MYLMYLAYCSLPLLKPHYCCRFEFVFNIHLRVRAASYGLERNAQHSQKLSEGLQ